MVGEKSLDRTQNRHFEGVKKRVGVFEWCIFEHMSACVCVCVCRIFCIPGARLTSGGSVWSRVKSRILPGNVALSGAEICSHCVKAEREVTRLCDGAVKHSLPTPDSLRSHSSSLLPF